MKNGINESVLGNQENFSKDKSITDIQNDIDNIKKQDDDIKNIMKK